MLCNRPFSCHLEKKEKKRKRNTNAPVPKPITQIISTTQTLELLVMAEQQCGWHHYTRPDWLDLIIQNQDEHIQQLSWLPRFASALMGSPTPWWPDKDRYGNAPDNLRAGILGNWWRFWEKRTKKRKEEEKERKHELISCQGIFTFWRTSSVIYWA